MLIPTPPKNYTRVDGRHRWKSVKVNEADNDIDSEERKKRQRVQSHKLHG